VRPNSIYNNGKAGSGLGIDLGGAAHDHGVGVGECGQQRGPVGAVDMADVEVAGEDVERGGSQLFCDEYDGSHWLPHGILECVGRPRRNAAFRALPGGSYGVADRLHPAATT